MPFLMAPLVSWLVWRQFSDICSWRLAAGCCSWVLSLAAEGLVDTSGDGAKALKSSGSCAWDG